jgi:branched-chain amino acid transport system substrate-binding protein
LAATQGLDGRPAHGICKEEQSMKGRGGLVVSLAVLVAAALASTAGAGSSSVATSNAAQAASCKGTIKIGIITPLTGDAGFLGQEQLSWAKLAVKRLAPQLGLKVQLLQGDMQLDNALAASLAQRYLADPQVMAVLGPATSGAAGATSKTFFAAKMATVNMSATNTALTKGANKTGTPSFFRVIPDDSVQGPTDARYMAEKLNAEKVVLVDAREPYSVGLANSTQATLRRLGVTTIRESVSIDQSDFSSLVTKIPGDTDVVFAPFQQPPKVQTLAQQLVEQGKRAVVFGTDGANDPDSFNFPGSYVSNFAGPIDQYPYNKPIIDAWRRDNPGDTLGSFGPPTYGAAQVALTAIKRACTKMKNGSITRNQVLQQVRKVRIRNWILGGNFRFSTKTHDPLNAKFVIFQIQRDGSYKVVS